jgi:hypothetical protein
MTGAIRKAKEARMASREEQAREDDFWPDSTGITNPVSQAALALHDQGHISLKNNMSALHLNGKARKALIDAALAVLGGLHVLTKDGPFMLNWTPMDPTFYLTFPGQYPEAKVVYRLGSPMGNSLPELKTGLGGSPPHTHATAPIETNGPTFLQHKSLFGRSAVERAMSHIDAVSGAMKST